MSHAPSVAAARTTALVMAGELLNRSFVLPLLVFYPTSRCNSRCVSCDWWRASGADDLRLDEIADLAGSLPRLGTEVVAFSGGEPLLRPEVFRAADLFAARGLRLQLLTSGVLLARFAEEVARRFERVTVSLDAATPELYRTIRGVSALGVLEEGVAKLKRLAPGLPVTGRATLHRLNFRELPRLIAHARRIQLDGISFLPADVSSTAFGRATAPAEPGALALTVDEVREFEAVIERTLDACRADLESGFVAESSDKLRRLPRYYAAIAGDAPFPPAACNAPWISVVLEADGGVRPCFFHAPVGNIRVQPLGTIVSDNLPAFRRTLDVATNAVCARCVCSLKAGWRNAPWR